MLNLQKIKDLVASKDISALKKYMGENNLVLDKLHHTIVPANKKEIAAKITYLDQTQHIKKIFLNSIFGLLSNDSSRWSDKRIGQSITLTGRCVVRHMSAMANKLLTGKYDYQGETVLYNDTDSVASNTGIETSVGSMTIEELFKKGKLFKNDHGKEYSFNDLIQITQYNNYTHGIQYQNYAAVYRHKVTKKRYVVTTSAGRKVCLTEDHGIMIIDNGNLISKSPAELKIGDKIISAQ
ncbi:DNA polymerase family B [uncultured archaeon]|nr:DNA polymerase family B [uncultured archaeon]